MIANAANDVYVYIHIIYLLSFCFSLSSSASKTSTIANMSMEVAVRCRCITQNGEQCKRWTKKGYKCAQHLQQQNGLRIQKSLLPRAGLGLFTTRNIPKG